MINCSFFNIFNSFYETVWVANKQIKKVEKSISSIFYKQMTSPHSLEKQKVSKVRYQIPVITGVALVISAVFAYFYLKNAAVFQKAGSMLVEPLISEEDCASLLRMSTGKIQFIEDNLDKILFCQDKFFARAFD